MTILRASDPARLCWADHGLAIPPTDTHCRAEFSASLSGIRWQDRPGINRNRPAVHVRRHEPVLRWLETRLVYRAIQLAAPHRNLNSCRAIRSAVSRETLYPRHDAEATECQTLKPCLVTLRVRFIAMGFDATPSTDPSLRVVSMPSLSSASEINWVPFWKASPCTSHGALF